MKTIKARLTVIAATIGILLLSMLPSLLTGLVDGIGTFILAGLVSTCVISIFLWVAIPVASWIIYGDETKLGDMLFFKICDWAENLDNPKKKIEADTDYIDALKELENL